VTGISAPHVRREKNILYTPMLVGRATFVTHCEAHGWRQLVGRACGRSSWAEERSRLNAALMGGARGGAGRCGRAQGGGLGRGNAGRSERPDLRRSAGRCERPDLRRTHKEFLPIPQQEAHDSTSDSLGHHRIRRFANGRAASSPAGGRAPSAATPRGGHAATPPGRSGQQGSSGMGAQAAPGSIRKIRTNRFCVTSGSGG
jgi:hypothetical protein